MAWEGYTEWLDARRVAQELKVDYGKVLEWAKRDIDPLPVRFPEGNHCQWRVFRKDLNEWLFRHWTEASWM